MSAASTDSSSIHLQNLLLSLSSEISSLDDSSSDLVMPIIYCEWISRNEDYISIYLKFLGNLATAHSFYIPQIIEMLVSLFHCIGDNDEMSSLSTDRLHCAIKYIIDLVPTSRAVLCDTMIKNFPHKSESCSACRAYLLNMLRSISYLNQYKSKIICTIIDKIIRIDVEIQIEIEELSNSDEVLYHLHQKQNLQFQSNTSEWSEGYVETRKREESEQAETMNVTIEDSEAYEENKDSSEIDSNVKRSILLLDILLSEFFIYLEPRLQYRSNEADSLFNSLLAAFSNSIIMTFKCRFTQFLLFWSSQLHNEYCELYLGLLLEMTFGAQKSTMLRVMSSMYLASFVARAKSLSGETVKIIVDMHCDWLSRFLEDNEAECECDVQIDFIGRYGSFYGICQSLMYIFCFRWSNLRGNVGNIEDDDGEDCSDWTSSLCVLPRVIISRFNPLLFCSKIVVKQFAELAHYLNLVHCQSKIEANKASLLSPIGKIRHIDSYFPFDPYELKNSSRFGNQNYNDWSRPDGMDEDDDDDED